MTQKCSIMMLLLLISTILTGCQNDYSSSRWAMIKTIDPEPLIISEKEEETDKKLVQDIKKETNSVDSIYDVAVIKGEKDTLVAYKVKHLYRYKMIGIEKELKDKLKEKFPDESFTLSSDFKIFLETIRLWDKMQNADFSEKKANKRLKEIIELNNELT